MKKADLTKKPYGGYAPMALPATFAAFITTAAGRKALKTGVQKFIKQGLTRAKATTKATSELRAKYKPGGRPRPAGGVGGKITPSRNPRSVKPKKPGTTTLAGATLDSVDRATSAVRRNPGRTVAAAAGTGAGLALLGKAGGKKKSALSGASRSVAGKVTKKVRRKKAVARTPVKPAVRSAASKSRISSGDHHPPKAPKGNYKRDLKRIAEARKVNNKVVNITQRSNPKHWTKKQKTRATARELRSMYDRR